MEDWTAFYAELLAFTPVADEQRFGVLLNGRILQSPRGNFFVQLIEPGVSVLDIEGEESLQRAGFGCADVMASVAVLCARGAAFNGSVALHSERQGALTKSLLNGVMCELVCDQRFGLAWGVMLRINTPTSASSSSSSSSSTPLTP